jgi:YVTN family beta-propeller protein
MIPEVPCDHLLGHSDPVVSSSCSSDSTGERPVPSVRPAFDRSRSGTACGPTTHPGARVIHKVVTRSAYGIAVRDDGLACFTEPYQGGVGITSAQSRTALWFIPTGDIPTEVDFSPDGATAYVTNQYSQNVGVVDVAGAQQVATISLSPANPFVVRVSPDGARLFISTSGTTVYVADTQTRAITAAVEVGDPPNAFAVSPDGRTIYVSPFEGGTVSEIDIFRHAVLRTFQVGGVPQDMAVARNGKRLYVANQDGNLNEIDLTTGRQETPIPLGWTAFGIGVTPDDAQAYVSLVYEGLVRILDLQSRRCAKTLQVGGYPRRIAFSRQGGIAAVANEAGFVTFVR